MVLVKFIITKNIVLLKLDVPFGIKIRFLIIHQKLSSYNRTGIGPNNGTSSTSSSMWRSRIYYYNDQKLMYGYVITTTSNV
mmetsp:Transcript_14809/g.16989  ORF Transcript_14809/g.16989 Transcript_14809/m.16989 type:complete len:81 (-) Transcript_14809:181-423(-)